jgi:hypothetical protein
MTLIEQDLWGVIGSLAGGRVYSHRLPENVIFPAIVFRLLDTDPLRDQRFSLRHPTYRFDVWTTSYDDLVNTTASLRTAIDHNTTIHGLYDDELDVPERSEGVGVVEAETGLYHRVIDFTMWENG